MTKPLDAIFFDIDDTLFSTTVFADKARRAAIDAMLRAGLRANREDARREPWSCANATVSNGGWSFTPMPKAARWPI